MPDTSLGSPRMDREALGGPPAAPAPSRGCLSPSRPSRIPPSPPRALERKPRQSGGAWCRVPDALPHRYLGAGGDVINRFRGQTGLTFPSRAKCGVYSFPRRRAELNAIVYLLGAGSTAEIPSLESSGRYSEDRGKLLLFLRGEGGELKQFKQAFSSKSSQNLPCSGRAEERRDNGDTALGGAGDRCLAAKPQLRNK